MRVSIPLLIFAYLVKEVNKDTPTHEEIVMFNKKLHENNSNFLCKMIEEHSLKYFFNLKLDEGNKLTLFHKIILLDLTKLFHLAIEKFKIKFKNYPGRGKDLKENAEGLNKILISLDEKSTIDNEEYDMSLVSLLSMKDREGNTPILFAAFRGNLEIVKELVDLGVNYENRNRAGLNIIHMAAQSDNPNIIVYFKEKYNMNLFEKDEQGNSSLHWACSSGSKMALDYLLSYITEEAKNLDVINAVNYQGQTALHITILTTGSISSIKKLIKKGIDFTIKDKNNLDVFELVKNNDKYKNMEKTLEEYTHRNMFGLNYHINDKLNIYYKCILFAFLIVLVECIIFFLFMPYLNSSINFPEILSYTYYISSVCLIMSYIYIIQSDPGVIPMNNLSWIEILSINPVINKMCPYCRVEQTKYSKHCFLCNKCIEVYDHHCHWINNCVGQKNKPFFLFFIVLLLLNLAVDFYLSFEVLATEVNIIDTIQSGEKIMDNVYIRKTLSLLMMFLTAFFFFPISYLFYRQITSKNPMLSQQKEIQEYYRELKEIKDEANSSEIKTN